MPQKWVDSLRSFKGQVHHNMWQLAALAENVIAPYLHSICIHRIRLSISQFDTKNTFKNPRFNDVMINPNRDAQHRQYDDPWVNLLHVIPEVELPPLISAVVKMQRNEAILTRSELTAYYNWYIRFETDMVENLLESFSDADFDLLASVEQKIHGEAALMPWNLDTFYQIYSQFENVTGMTSITPTSDSDIDLLISIEEKMRRCGSILTPRELDVYRHWHHQIGILNPFKFGDA